MVFYIVCNLQDIRHLFFLISHRIYFCGIINYVISRYMPVITKAIDNKGDLNYATR